MKIYFKYQPLKTATRLAWICMICITFYSCGIQKYLQPGEVFYNGATVEILQDTIKVENAKSLNNEIKKIIRPNPNKKTLGRRQKVWYYFIAGEPKKEKGLKHWLKYKMGEPPVLMNDVNPERNIQIITNYLENNGFYFAKATYDSVWGKKEGKVNYQITPGNRYKIGKVVFPPDSNRYHTIIKKVESESLLKQGNYYSFETLKAERSRIDEWLKNNGFYFFNPDYILLRGDSTVGDHKVDLHVTIKPETPVDALKQWYIKDIFIYPNYNAFKDTIKVDSSFWESHYYVIDQEDEYKPKVFERVISLEPGMLYNRGEHNKTLSRLVNVGTFQYVKNQFEEIRTASPDSGWLNAQYHLISSKKRSLRLETSGKTSSANLAGVELNLNWRNRNWFKGAEQLMLKVYGGFDIQFAGQNKGYNIYHVGAEGSITWPRIVPFKRSPKGSFVPYTKLSLSNDWQNRQKLYTVNTLKAAYSWAWRPDLRHEHTLTPFEVTYVDNKNVTQEYLDQIAQDSSLARVIEEQLMIGPTYGYIYTNTINPKKANGIYYRANIDLSNNLLGLAQGADAASNNFKKVLGVQYSQFVKTEQDLRYYRKLSATTTDQQWVSRLNLGIGFPYGNSLQLPYIKQFYTGGSNSLRAFRVRSVGPGTYRPVVQPDGFIPDLVGDIKLEMNTEWRGKIVGLLHGAVFVDAGNIWLFNENATFPGGKFSSSFFKELAVGTGMGLRFDIAGIFMMRLDLGIPIRKPWLPDGERWVIDQMEFGDKDWRKENLVFNLAVGLPF